MEDDLKKEEKRKKKKRQPKLFFFKLKMTLKKMEDEPINLIGCDIIENSPSLS